MTVFDEILSGNEYSDMEFEEFLEFLVRISYILPFLDPDAQPVKGKKATAPIVEENDS